MTTAQHQRTPEGIPAFLAHRIPGWLEDGFERDELLTVLRSLGTDAQPGSERFVRPLVEQAERHEAHSTTASTAQQTRDHLLQASFYYFLARFPHILSPLAAQAYERGKTAYLRASQFFGAPLEVVRFPSAQGDVTAYLRLPQRQAGPAPAVLLSGGIDVWKGDPETHQIAEALLAEGLAVLALDMPGTGESPVPCGPQAETVFIAGLDYLRTRQDVDGRRLGSYGLSFGGHWMTKLALTRPDIMATVNVGGPVARTFEQAWSSQLPIGALVALAAIFGETFSELGPQGVAQRLAALSLDTQGLLRSRPDQGALLSINGALDELVTIEDVYVLTERGVQQDTLVFADDRHVASRNRALHLPFAAHWLAQRLHAPAHSRVAV